MSNATTTSAGQGPAPLLCLGGLAPRRRLAAPLCGGRMVSVDGRFARPTLTDPGPDPVEAESDAPEEPVPATTDLLALLALEDDSPTASSEVAARHA